MSSSTGESDIKTSTGWDETAGLWAGLQEVLDRDQWPGGSFGSDWMVKLNVGYVSWHWKSLGWARL